MAKHMSVRLAWHNEGWNGHVCKKPCENSYCSGQHSYPGDLIAKKRDLEYESEHAGELYSSLLKPPACGLSINAFGKDTINVRVDTPDFWNSKDADPIMLTLPPYTVCTWCYEKMYDEAAKATENSSQQYNYANRRKGAEEYFAQFEPEKSLIFYYAGYSNPFCENEDINYVLVGISKLKNIGSIMFYKNPSKKVIEKYAGGFVWQIPVTSNYPDEGFCIPFWKYMDDEEILEKIVIKPKNRNPFKYGSREVDNDDAIEVINQFVAVVDTLIAIGDDSEDWKKRKDWLNAELIGLWKARGPFPGFPSILECLHLNSLISKYTSLTTNKEMRDFMNEVHELLEGKTAIVRNIKFDTKELKLIRRNYQLMGKEATNLLFNVLSRFDLRPEQIKKIISEDRGKASITADISDIAENPYIIFEQYIGSDPDDTIPLYKIDNGIIPSPEYGLDEIFDSGSAERLRAFCVDELNRIAAHSFGKADIILQSINNRISRLPEWKQYVYKIQNFKVDKEVLDGALVQREDKDGAIYLYLKHVYEDERSIEQILRSLVNRPDISLPVAITPEKFKNSLRMPQSVLVEKQPQRYEEIIDNQAKICMRIFSKPICVLSGAAGTGKTTVISAILDNIKQVHGYASSFLLMAPTGKAAERIKKQTKKNSSTIHSFLAKNGWINENFTLKRVGGNKNSDFNTIIIDECSMIDLSLFAALLRAINWNSVQRLILVGDPNQLPPIGRGKVFCDVISWMKKEFPENFGKLTDNIRQLENQVNENGCGILQLADIFIQENQQSDDSLDAIELKRKKESLFERILEKGNGDVEEDLAVYFWNEQEELESLLTNVMMEDMAETTKMDVASPNFTPDLLWQQMIRNKDKSANPEAVQVISPYRGEFYGTGALNLLMQKAFNSYWSSKMLDGIGYYDKVIQFRNRPKSDPAYAYDEKLRKTVPAEIYNGEIGLTVVHEEDFQGNSAQFRKNFKDNWYIKRMQVKFSGDSRKGFKYVYGENLGRDQQGKWIPDQTVEENLELAYAISVHKSQGSEFDFVYIVIPHRESHLLSMELLYTAITRAQKKVTILLQQDISTLSMLGRTDKSAVKKINSSVFMFSPLPDEILYAGAKWYESGKKIATLSEYYVRSKSEAIIVNLLVDRNIPFKYEKPLRAKDGTMYLPDFTVTFRGEEYYWEHVGLLNDPGYMTHWEKKQKWYEDNFPGRLLTTMESNNLTKDAIDLIESHI